MCMSIVTSKLNLLHIGKLNLLVNIVGRLDD